MKAYSNFLKDLSSPASFEAKTAGKDQSETIDTKKDDDEDHGLRLASEPGYREQGNVMIELNLAEDQFSGKIKYVTEALANAGFGVRVRYRGDDVSFEGGSDGLSTGGVSFNGEHGTNNLVNGVAVPNFTDSDVYKVVKVLRPEDHAPDEKGSLLYLMNGDGDMKNYLTDEGYKVATDAETLQALLTA